MRRDFKQTQKKTRKLYVNFFIPEHVHGPLERNLKGIHLLQRILFCNITLLQKMVQCFGQRFTFFCNQKTIAQRIPHSVEKKAKIWNENIVWVDGCLRNALENPKQRIDCWKPVSKIEMSQQQETRVFSGWWCCLAACQFQIISEFLYYQKPA